MGHGGGCELCPGRQRNVVAGLFCETCSAKVCCRHARSVEGATTCTRCVRHLPAEARRQALAMSR